MHPKVLSSEAWRIIRKLVSADLVAPWVLGGGTGLALQFGHRYSEDLDFFGSDPFDPDRIAADLSRIGTTSIQSRSADTLHVSVGGLRLSFLRSDPPLLFPGLAYRGLTVADPRDIAAMKVIAIGGRGSRKDFVDLYVYLEGGGTLPGVLSMIATRFARLDYNQYHLLKSLVYFEDAESEPMPRMIRDVDWETIKATLVDEVRRLS